MKKLFCVFALFVFLPCSVSSADGIDTGKPFLIAKACKVGQISKQDYYSNDRVLNNSGCGGSGSGSEAKLLSLSTCPAGQYRKGGPGNPCVDLCTGITCSDGNTPVNCKKTGLCFLNGCCCVGPH